MLGFDIGIDLGTANTRVIVRQKIVLKEASTVAMDAETMRPIAYGNEARRMVGRTHKKIKTVLPIQRGFIADYEAAEVMLKYYLRKVCGNQMFKPRVMVCMPSRIPNVQRRSLMKVLSHAGARRVCLIESPVAAAIGAGVDFSTPHGAIVVDVGAGVTDVAVLSMGGLAVWDSLKIASQDIDDAIIRYARREYNMLIGASTAEHVKKTVATLAPGNLEIAVSVKGRNLFSGLPQTFEMTAAELKPAILEPVDQIVSGIQSVLERTPPELAGDIFTDGIILTGNGSLLSGFADYLSGRLNAPVHPVSDPDSCVVKGTGVALRNLDLLKNGDYQFNTLQDIVVDY